MAVRASLKAVSVVVGLSAAGVIGPVPPVIPAGLAANPPKPAISDEIRAALAQMAKSLLADQFSFQARTLRVYVDQSGQPLHIAHSIRVVVRRPDRLMISVTGDDGSTKLFYDGKTI